MKKSVEHQKASNVLYQNLSDEVADTRVEISRFVDDINQNISMFHQATTNDLVTLQESINRLPDSCLQPIQDTMAGTTLLSELQAGSENSAQHADSVTGHCLVDNETAAGNVDSVFLRSFRFKFTTEPIISLWVSYVLSYSYSQLIIDQTWAYPWLDVMLHDKPANGLHNINARRHYCSHDLSQFCGPRIVQRGRGTTYVAILQGRMGNYGQCVNLINWIFRLVAIHRLTRRLGRIGPGDCWTGSFCSIDFVPSIFHPYRTRADKQGDHRLREWRICHRLRPGVLRGIKYRTWVNTHQTTHECMANWLTC